MRRRRPASRPDARGRTAWPAVPGLAAGGSTGDRRGSPRRNTRRSPDRRRRPRRHGTGRVAGAVLPGCPRCRRRERSGRRTPPASPGSGSADQQWPGRLPGAQLSHPRACGAGGADRGSGFSSPDSPSFGSSSAVGRARKCATTRGPGTWRAGFTVVPGLGGWLQVRQSSAWSALSRARSEHGQDSPGGTRGQLRLGRTEGHLDQLGLARLRSRRAVHGPGRRACRRSCPPPGRRARLAAPGPLLAGAGTGVAGLDMPEGGER